MNKKGLTFVPEGLCGILLSLNSWKKKKYSVLLIKVHVPIKSSLRRILLNFQLGAASYFSSAN
jgi:hypothetical protein